MPKTSSSTGADDPLDKGFGMDVQAVVRRWRRSNGVETFAVTVPKGDLESFHALVEKKGWKIII